MTDATDNGPETATATGEDGAAQPTAVEATDAMATGGQQNLDLIMRIPVSLQVVLGRARMPVAELMRLQRGSVIGLDQHVGDPIELTANGRTIARGEVVLMDDDETRFGVSLTEIVSGALDMAG